MDCIDISSSDSDLEIEEDRETDAFVRGSTASTNTRVLPSWASGHSTNLSSKGYDGQSQSQRFPSPKVASASNQSSLNRSNEQANGSIYPAENRNGGQAQTTSFRGSNVHSTDHAKDLASQSSKRTLPHSLQPSTSASNSKHLDGNEGGSQIHNNYGRSYPSGLDIGKRYMAPQFNGATADELIAYENSGYRILPPSLVHGRSVPAQYASSGDAMYHSGIGEEGALGNDERLIYQAALQDLNQPKIEASLPDGLLSISLLRHQKIALAWMLQKETRSLHCLGGILADDQGLGKTISMIALILMQRYLQSKSKSEKISNHKAEAFNLDDDDDGDSKNVVVDNGSAGLCKEEAGESSKPKLIPEASSSTRAFSSKRPAAGTLVVCPASVLRQWARELDEKVAPEGKLSVLVYHGGNRTRDPVELAKYDVIVTTYSIVTNEVPKQPLVDEEDSDEKNGEKYGLSSEFSAGKRKKKTSNAGRKGKKGKKGIDFSSFEYGCGPLARVGWFRVILDEAQTIKNHRTLVARACCSLRAKRRWCLSGTPIQNSIDDLYSYFRFLKYDPYAVYKSFYNTIKVQISRNSIQGYKKLQAVLRAIMLRRTKGTLIDGEPIITLPPKSICLAKVDFSPEERVFYSKLEADSRLQFKEYAAAGTLNQNYANILLLLLRLRQACDHPLLVKGFNTDSVRKESTEMARRLPRDMLVNLLSLLETSSAICCECRDPPEDAVVTMCGHVFCYQCVLDFLTGDENTCPAPKCKEQLGSDVIFSRATLRKCISNDFDSSLVNGGQSNENSIVLQQEYSSSKIKACLEILQSHCDGKKAGSEPFDSRVGVTELTTSGSGLQSEGPVKAIVFSQWTSMLNLVELSLNQSCIQYRRLDGTMSLAARDRAVKDFNNDPEITVMLMSLKAGNLGLNMVAANHVILMDLWWNPTTEDQAIDRAHRIGQNRPVTVSRVTIKNTVEDRILALQEEKRKMVASAFGEDHGGGSATRLTVEDLKYLFMA